METVSFMDERFAPIAKLQTSFEMFFPQVPGEMRVDLFKILAYNDNAVVSEDEFMSVMYVFLLGAPLS